MEKAGSWRFRCYTKTSSWPSSDGASLKPPPPKGSKHPDIRYYDIHEGDDPDERQLVSWIEQASRLPGEKMSSRPLRPREASRCEDETLAVAVDAGGAGAAV